MQNTKGKSRRSFELKSSRERCLDSSYNSRLSLSRKVTLPYPDNTPSELPQLSINFAVPRDVALKLRKPKVGPSFRCVAEFATKMAMPEAPIDEDGDSRPWKDEIWSPEYVLIAPPSGGCRFAEQFYQPKLRISIFARTNTRHDGRALFWCEDISHNRLMNDSLYTRAERAMAELKGVVYELLDGAPGGLTNAEIGRAVGIYQGHVGHEGHVSRTILALLESEEVAIQDSTSKRWILRRRDASTTASG